MSNVIPLTRKEPTLSGDARCLCCNHDWIACAPVGCFQLECPVCKTMKGVFVNPVQRSDEEWDCRCGNGLFRVSRKGIYCPNCGDWQELGA